MSISQVVERIRREPPYADPEGIFPEKRYVCRVLDPIPWDRQSLERSLGLEIPEELATFWNVCGGVVLYEDNLHGMWGLVVFPPSDEEVFPPSESTLFNLNSDFRDSKADWILPGDLVIGRFWGDAEKPLIRCDRSVSDYGNVIVASEIGGRDEWTWAAPSLEEFLSRFMESRTRKFWSYHYRKEQAEKAAQQKP